MRILHVLPYFSPRMGGVARVVYDMARHLSHRGHDVTVVASDYKQDEVRFPRSDFRQVLLHSVFSRWGFYYTPSLVGWMRDHVAEFDVMHLHEVRTFQNAVARWYALRCGVPYVLSAHGTFPVILERKVAKRIYDLLVGQRVLASARRLVAVSSFEAEQYREVGHIEEERTRVIYNGLDLHEFSPLPPRGLLRQELGIAQETPMVLSVGRLHRIKGIDLLIRAFALLEREAHGAILVIVGPDAGELASLQALAHGLQVEEQIRFVGPLYGEAKLAAYVDADVVASPGAYEIFGLVPFEALMCGTQVVVGDGNGVSRLIRDAQAGYIVPSGDVDALANTLSRVLTDDTEAQQTVAAGQAFVDKELDWRVIAGKVEGLYNEIVRGRRQLVNQEKSI